MKTKLPALLLIGLCVVVGFCAFALAHSSSAPQLGPPTVQIRENIVAMLQRKAPITVLPDIPGGSSTATNRDAAYFAWQEFIALSWANVPVTGQAATSKQPGAREVAD